MDLLPILEEPEPELELSEEPKPEEVPIFVGGKKPKKKLSEKQLAHLANMRVKAQASNKKHKKKMEELAILAESQSDDNKETEEVIEKELVEEPQSSNEKSRKSKPKLSEEERVERDYYKFKEYMDNYNNEKQNELELLREKEAEERIKMDKLREEIRKEYLAEQRIHHEQHAEKKRKVVVEEKAKQALVNQRNPIAENFASDNWF